jgi:polysaccharide biosynthesis transport protein
VLIDTPPLLPVTDAAILAKMTGGALVVAGADALHRQQLTDGLGSLEDVGARVLGVVLNRLKDKQSDAYSYYGYAAARGTGTKRNRTHTRAAAPGTKQQHATRSGTRPSPSRSDPSDDAGIGPQPVPVSSPHEDNP